MTLQIPLPQLILHSATAKFLEKIYSEVDMKTPLVPEAALKSKAAYSTDSKPASTPAGLATVPFWVCRMLACSLPFAHQWLNLV